MLRLGAVPIILNYSERRLLAASKEEFLRHEDPALERQNVLQSMLFEIFSRILAGHPREEVLELLGGIGLREGAAPDRGQDLSGPVIVSDGDHGLARARLKRTSRALRQNTW